MSTSAPLSPAVLSLLALGLSGGCAPQPGVCHEGQVATPVAASRDPQVGYHLHGHAHNDYEHDHPLFDALGHHFYSVEADIYLDGSTLAVSHLNLPWEARRPLEQLYLDPLQARVDEMGSVYGDGEPFTLWIDLKQGSRELVDRLHDTLERYPMLTRFEGDTVTPGPVTVVLTGDAGGKKDFVTRFSERRALRDSNDYSPDDPPADNAWGYYALAWGDYLRSSGDGQLDDTQRARLACIIENAHAQGRKVRFYDAPDKPESWRVQLEFGVDFLSTDDLPGLDTFLEQAP